MRKAWAVTATVLTLAASGLISTGTASAVTPTTIVANFTGDTAGAKPNGFASVGAPQMHFYDTVSTGLVVGDYGVQSHGNSLAIFGTGALEIRLAAPTSAISLAFGNDDPGLSTATDLARLTLFRGTTQVDQIDVHFNANDVMDQTVGTPGGPLFTRAVFQYVNSGGTPIGVTEVVDDITVGPLCTISGNSGNNHLVGTGGNDVICGDSGNDVISGGGGDDIIYGGSGKDDITGGKGKDLLFGGSGKDSVTGGKGRDQLNGGKGKDHLNGATGKDQLNGGTGQDHCDGGKGHDTATACEINSNIP
jgi:Ca2+-binding RTX toxin-like protein